MTAANKFHSIWKFIFRFFFEKPSWCQIFVSEGSLLNEQYLGGDSIEIVKERLEKK